MKYCFGVDIGGTTVKWACSRQRGLFWKMGDQDPHRRRGKGNPSGCCCITQGEKAEHDLADADIIGVGVGVPAPVTEEGIVFGSANLGWKYKEVKKSWRS